MLGAAQTGQYAGWWATSRRTFPASTNTAFAFSSINSGNYSTAKARFGAGSLDVTTITGTAPTQTGAAVSYNPSPKWSGPWPYGLTQDFCIEGWTWIPAARNSTQTAVIVDSLSWTGIPLGGGGSLSVRFGTYSNSGDFNALNIFAAGVADLDYAAYTWPRDQWVHWAVQRASGVVSLWANGNKLNRQDSPVSNPSGIRTAANYTFRQVGTGASINDGLMIGFTGDEYPALWLDEVCCSNTWRYDDSYSTYVVPTAPFTVDTGTDFLIHFDTNITSASS